MRSQVILLLFCITAFKLVPSTEASLWEVLETIMKTLGDSAVSALVVDTNSTEEELKEDVIFYLWTRANPETSEVLCVDDETTLSESNFDPSVPTRIFIHGWQGFHNKSFGTTIRDALLEAGEFNVVGVDWSAYTSLDYFSTRAKVATTAYYVAEFIDFLVNQGMSITDLTLIGHSMGAHVCGIASRNAANKVPLIIACDPAGPLFVAKYMTVKLKSTDADHVQVVHTNAGTLGFDDNLGVADFWPNGGAKQPGCTSLIDFGLCSHERSWKYVAESFTPNATKFIAQACESLDLYQDGSCSSNATSYIGRLNPDTNASGVYYFETHNASAYSMD